MLDIGEANQGFSRLDKLFSFDNRGFGLILRLEGGSSTNTYKGMSIHTPYAAINGLCMSQNTGMRYDFDASPPGTRAEIRAWLTSQLSIEPLPDAQIRKEIDGDVWVVEHGFRRAFYSHSAVRLERTGEFAFLITDDDMAANSGGNAFAGIAALPRHSTLEAMIEGAAETYARLWKIAE